MPTSTCAIPEANLLFARCYGHIAPEDVIGWDIETKIASSEDGQLNALVDLSDITGTDMTFDDINTIHGKLVRHYQPRNQKLLLILYAPDDLAFGMTRIMQSLSGMTDHIDVQIFRESESLAEYLPALNQSLQDLRSKALEQGSRCSA
ncbi:hypothetical protein [Cognatishimia activa]|uniref:hypothetical protein n=1 Tax=Cognatishimia activa TaxID=1715691 RepID=UPI0022329595|nr:hypothetical protein [Cognatishimia activa]UZD92354.1 hypothetical protein M0D42_07025 [Cognatishimia activa]